MASVVLVNTILILLELLGLILLYMIKKIQFKPPLRGFFFFLFFFFRKIGFWDPPP